MGLMTHVGISTRPHPFERVDFSLRFMSRSVLMKRIEIEAYIYILVGATLWSFSGVVARYLFNIGTSPLKFVKGTGVF